MLELPETHTLAVQLQNTLTGKTILDVKAARSPHRFAWYYGEPDEYPARLCGRQITGAVARAGFVEIIAENIRLSFQDGVRVRYYAPESKLPLKHQLAVTLDDGSALICTVQMYGGMLAFEDGSYDNPYYNVAGSKPEPLTNGFSMQYFQNLYQEADPKLSLKAFLATKQRIPGLGNGCLQDILFQAGMHPQTTVSSLKQEDVEKLYHSLRSVLASMTEAGGRNTEIDLFGNPGGYRCVLSSKTLVLPCPVCGDSIVRKTYLGGNVYFCPTCQPLKKQ